MAKTLKERTSSALIWNLLDKFGQQVLFFIVGVILARVLDVADFGLVNMLAIFTALSTIISDSGFSYAIMRERDITQIQCNTVFYFNISISIALYLILFFAAPLIASFYNEPQLTALSRVIFLSVIFNAAGSIQSALLMRNLQFNIFAKLSIAALICSSVVTLIFAFTGMGVWTLVCQTVSLSFFRSLFYWLNKNWLPTKTFQLQALKNLFGFSKNLLFASTFNAAFDNIYSLIIGKVYSKEQLGFYDRGNKYQNMIMSALADTYRNVAVPVLSEVQNDIERRKRVFHKIIKNISFIIIPVTILLVVVSKPFIIVLIGEKWIPSIRIMQILCMAGATQALISMYHQLYIAAGKAKLYFNLEILRKIILVAGIICFIQYGIIALAWVWLGYMISSLVLYSIVGNRIINYNLLSLIKDVAPYIILSIIIITPIYFLKYIISNLYILPIIQSILFLGVYIGLSYFLKIGEFEEFKNLFISTKKKLKL